ncbi:hypothetical protein JCM33374_g1844 [Metschnikowia sp. JCM 33374]|nr:hypothetical protein JCM33374_g1844 [Metschnikowia sp. JCM 33374]
MDHQNNINTISLSDRSYNTTESTERQINISNQQPNEAQEEQDDTSSSKQAVSVPRANYVPPLNFSLVEDGIYRSGFPMPINYPFLKQLKIKTIIYLGDLGEEKPKKKKKEENGSKSDKLSKPGEASNTEKEENQPGEKDETAKEKKPKKDKHGTAEIFDNYKAWIATTDIKFHHLVMHSSQEPFISNTEEGAQMALIGALSLMLDKQNFPILIHSNKGKHRIGVLVGLMRKLFQGWCMSGIFEEYEKFAMGKSEYDLEFIELWQPELSYEEKHLPEFVRI